MDQAHGMEVFETAECLNGDFYSQSRRHRTVLCDPFLDVRSVDELPHHVVRAVVELREVVQHRQVLVFDRGRSSRFLKKTLQSLIISGNVRPHDLDYAQLVQMDVTDLEDLSHPADTEAVEDLVLAVDQTRGIRALKTCDAFRTMRTLFELAVDRLFTTQTSDLGHGISGLGVARSRGENAARLR